MGSGRIIGSCGQKTAIVKDKRDGAKKTLNAQKKASIRRQIFYCKSTIWPGMVYFQIKSWRLLTENQAQKPWRSVEVSNQRFAECAWEIQKAAFAFTILKRREYKYLFWVVVIWGGIEFSVNHQAALFYEQPAHPVAIWMNFKKYHGVGVQISN